MNTKVMQTDLQAAHSGSYYFIAGCGGDLDEWVTGYTEELETSEIGTPVVWYRTTGAEVNAHAGEDLKPTAYLPEDLVCLLFPLDGLDVSRLAMFKIRMHDRWFDDVIDNMRNS